METLVIFFFMLLALTLTAGWIYVLVDIAKSDFNSESDKVLWLILVLFLPLIGSILYFTIGKKSVVRIEEEFV